MKTSTKKCAILSCKSHLSRHKYTYFQIPNEKHSDRKKLWLKALNILDDDLKKTKRKHHFVCGLHFKPADLGSQKFLNLSTIPSLFPNVQPSDTNINDFEEENESIHHPQPIKDTMSDLCRICLGTSDSFVSFNAELDFTCQTVCELVNYVTNVDIYEEEDQFKILPQHVCHKCIENLQIGFKLKNLAHESNNSLKDYLKTSSSNTDLDVNQEMIEEMETTSDPSSEEYSTSHSESHSSDNEENENRNIEGPLIVKQEMVADMETTSDPLAEEYSISHSENHSSDKEENQKRNFEGSLTPRSRTYMENLILESENRSMAVIKRQASMIADIRASLLIVPPSSSKLSNLHCPTSISASRCKLMFDTEAELKEFEEKLSEEAYRDKVIVHLKKYSSIAGHRTQVMGRLNSMINQIMSPRLRPKYNWSGFRKEKNAPAKAAFKYLTNTVTTLYECLTTLPNTDITDLSQMKHIITDYFKKQILAKNNTE